MAYTFGQASNNKQGEMDVRQMSTQTGAYTFGQASGNVKQAPVVEEKTLGRKTAEVLAPSTTNLSDYVRASTRLKSGEIANIQKEREAVQTGITQMEKMLPTRPDLAQNIADSKKRIAEIDRDISGVVSKADKTAGQKAGMALGVGLEIGSLPELAALGVGWAFGKASTKKILEVAPKNKVIQAINKATTVAPKTAQQDLAYKLAPLSGKAKTIAKETAKVLPETLAFGYGYDVSTNLQDKKEQPFTPGVGTAISASFPVAIGVTRLAKNAVFKPAEKKIADIVTKREKELFNIENNYSLLRKNMNFSKDANAASRRRIASTDILANAVDDTGTIRTTNPGGPVEQYRDQVLHGSEAIVRKSLEREGAYTTLDKIRAKIEKVIGDSRLTMDEKETAFSGIDKILAGFQRQYPDGNIPLVAIQDEKVNAGALAYKNLDPAVKTRLKDMTRAYKEILEESSNLNVKEMNDELSKYLKDISLLESLDGRKVKGGKLGKYFAQISGNLIGGATGSAIGGVPGAAIGTVIGGELASRIKGTALSRTLAGETGQVGVKSPVLKEAEQRAAASLANSNSGTIQDTIPLATDNASIIEKTKKFLRKNPRGMINLDAEIFPKKATLPAYKETGNITTKILKDLEGKSTVSKQYILDATNRGDLKQVERDLIRQVLEDMTRGSDNPLIQEAKKYKSAEEFVKAQGKPVFHGSTVDNLTELKTSSNLGRSGENQISGIYLTPDYQIASYYGRKNGVQVFSPQEVYTKGKILKVNDFTELKTKLGLKDLSSESKTKIPNLLKEKGYDGVFLKQGGEANEMIITNPDVVKTKSQLTDIYNQAQKSDTINVKEFADKVKTELLPLDRGGLGYNKYENITLPGEIRGDVKNYTENIYASPINTSAGDVHFSGDTGKYFGHTRVEDMADNNTRRVIEVQSDLYQKGNLDKEFDRASRIDGSMANKPLTKELAQETLDKYQTALDKWRQGKRKMSELSDDPYFYADSEEMLVKRVEDWKRLLKEAEGGKMDARKSELSKLQQYNDPTAHFRMVREEIKKAAEDGKTKLQFPTGETAMKIEGLGESRTHENVPNFASSQETFDISGKVDTNNPIYKFYEKEVGRYLSNKYGAKTITDENGVKWYEVAIDKKKHSVPVEAFAVGGIAALGAANQKAFAMEDNETLEKKDMGKKY